MVIFMMCMYMVATTICALKQDPRVGRSEIECSVVEKSHGKSSET